jgi:hypothetical protein
MTNEIIYQAVREILSERTEPYEIGTVVAHESNEYCGELVNLLSDARGPHTAVVNVNGEMVEFPEKEIFDANDVRRRAKEIKDRLVTDGTNMMSVEL